MRRPAAALLGTVAGTVLLVGAKYGAAAPAGNTSVTTVDEAGNPADPTASGAPTPGANAVSGPGGSAGPAASGRGTPSAAAGRTTPAPGRTTGAAPTTAAACTNASGNAANIASPGVGAITVSIQVCGGVVKTATGAQSRSNWEANQPAVPALNRLAVQYYKTDISKIRYSGATLTSNAYQASLRSALGKAGL